MKVKSESEVAQSCLTLSDPMDCSPPGSSVHGIFPARVLEWAAIAFSDLVLSVINYSLSSLVSISRLLPLKASPDLLLPVLGLQCSVLQEIFY